MAGFSPKKKKKVTISLKSGHLACTNQQYQSHLSFKCIIPVHRHKNAKCNVKSGGSDYFHDKFESTIVSSMSTNLSAQIYRVFMGA